MSNPQPKKNYTSLIDQLNQKINSEKRLSDLWSAIRLISFILFVTLFVLGFNFHWVVPVIIFYLSGYLFIRVVKKHNKISKNYKHLLRQKEVCEQELNTLETHKAYKGNGHQFKTDSHEYASDLDLLGEHSLYHFINRCQTDLGEQQLSKRLLFGLPTKNIAACNQAVKELSLKTEWLTAFMAISKSGNIKAFNQKALDDWKQLDLSWSVKNTLKILSFVMPIITISVITYLTINYSLLYGFLALIPNAMLIKHYLETMDDIVNKTDQSLKTIAQHSEIFKFIENASFESDLLINIQSKLSDKSYRSSKVLSQLSWYIEQLELKHNALGLIFNIISLWDFHFMRLLSKWKDTYQKDIDQWIWALSEMETLVSLSCLAHNNPEWCYPIIDNKHLSLNTRSAGHPLLHPRTRINNDLNMSIENHIRLITGSNMAGKSTFLRAIGCNIVLANAGSVCCAESFTLPKLSLFSSMRSNDALEESTSGFYAELKKLKRIIDVVSNKEHCFFLIDEVLKGTNTKDRHLGSVALIKQLIENPSAGLVSTHDLELASLEETTKGQVENWCFEVDVDGDKLSFDYRIKRGVSQSFNATHLMRNMGIKI